MSPGSSMILVVALARLKVSNMQAGWWYSFISPSSEKGEAVILASLRAGIKRGTCVDRVVTE